MAEMAKTVPGKPGTLYIPSLNKEVTIVDSREGDFYDSVTQAAGSITAGTKIKWFDSLSNKNVQHSNLTQQHRILGKSVQELTRIGVYVRQAFGATIAKSEDTIGVYENGACEFKIGERTIAQGPAITFQSGFGIGGNSTENETSFLSNGVPSLGAPPNLLKSQAITDQDDINAEIRFDDATWITGYAVQVLTNRMVASTFWRGIISKPLGV